jgi:hypothetical protein
MAEEFPYVAAKSPGYLVSFPNQNPKTVVSGGKHLRNRMGCGIKEHYDYCRSAKTTSAEKKSKTIVALLHR